jgi:hypothetical protein
MMPEAGSLDWVDHVMSTSVHSKGSRGAMDPNVRARAGGGRGKSGLHAQHASTVSILLSCSPAFISKSFWILNQGSSQSDAQHEGEELDTLFDQ